MSFKNHPLRWAPVLLLSLFFACQNNPGKNHENPGPDSLQTSQPDSSSHAANDPHRQQIALYKKMGTLTETQWDSVHNIVHTPRKLGNVERKQDFKVIGWHPYYKGSSWKSYDYDALWGLCYFSYDVNPATGGYKSIHDWKTTGVVEKAHENNTRVFLTANNFGGSNNHTLLSNPEATKNLIDSLVALVEFRQADGVNIDFESMRSEDRDAFTKFMTDLKAALKASNPDYTLSVALYTVDWNKVFDISALLEPVDLFVIMGYDYYYSGSPSAGPVAPLTSGDLWAPYNLEKSVEYYLDEGVPAKRLLLAIPYYGRQWVTTSDEIPGKTESCIKSPAYRDIMKMPDLDQSKVENTGQTAYLFSKTSAGKDAQLWYDDSLTLSHKYDYILKKELGGAGIWALGYDNGYEALWNLLEAKFGKQKGDAE